MGVFGHRYATCQFEGYVPTDSLEQYHILGQGGVIGIVKSSHAKMPNPTTLRPLGYVVDQSGAVINTKVLPEGEAPVFGRDPGRSEGDLVGRVIDGQWKNRHRGLSRTKS